MEYEALADALVAGAKSYIDDQLASLFRRMEALEARPPPVVQQAAGVADVMRNAEREVVFVLTNGEMRNIGRVDGADGKGVASEDLTQVVERAVDARMADLAPKEVDPVELAALVDVTVVRHVSALPPAVPGKDAEPVDPQMLRGMIVTELATMPPAKDGLDGKAADPAEVAEILRSQIEEPLSQRVADAIAAIPVIETPKDGANGKDADPSEIAAILKVEMEPVVRALIAEMIGALPPAKDGVDGKDAGPAEMQSQVAAEVTRQMEAAPKPRDGVDGKDGATGETGPMGPQGETGPAGETGPQGEMGPAGPAGADGKDGADGECGPVGPTGDMGPMGPAGTAAKDGADGRDGVGLTGALISRDGNLVLTLSDGGIRELGAVVGKDADMDALAAIIIAEIEKMPKPCDGVDGFQLTDLSFEYDQDRTITMRFTSGDLVREAAFTLPVPIHRGLWKEGAYTVGDMVIRDGSTWCCREDTTAMPGASTDWILTAKRGRDGKNTETVKIMPPTVKRDDPEKT